MFRVYYFYNLWGDVDDDETYHIVQFFGDFATREKAIEKIKEDLPNVPNYFICEQYICRN